MRTYTARQHEALKIIQSTMEERGIAPTLEEIATEMGGISRVAVLDHLRKLETKGAIRRKARESRAIEVLDKAYAPRSGLPMEGCIAAGEPILEVEDREEVELETWLGVRDGCYLLRVKGDSMIEDHICDGDLVLVQRATSAKDGDTVVAVLEDEVTLKRFYREKGGKVRLQPANTRLKARRVASSALKIRGVVRGVIRRT